MSSPMRNNSRKPRRGRRTRDSGSNSNEARYTLRAFNVANAVSNVYRRRMGGGTGTIATGAGGTIATATLCSSQSASTLCSDFASAANMYTQYRVVAMLVELFPYLRANTTAKEVTPCACVCMFSAGLGATTFAGALDTTGSKLISGYDRGRFVVNYGDLKTGDRDAQLWTPTNTSVAAAESYGLQIIDNGVATTATTNVWRYITWYLIEFRTAA